MMDFKVVGSSKREKKTDGIGLGDRGKRFSEIDARLLSETLGNKSGLVARDFTRGISLDTVDPFGTNRFPIARRRDKIKGTDRHDGVHFGLHSVLPLITVNRVDGFLVGFRVFAGSNEGGGKGELT